MKKLLNSNVHLHIRVKEKKHKINLGLILVVIFSSVITYVLTGYLVYELDKMDIEYAKTLTQNNIYTAKAATPSISSVTGTITNNGTITLAGSSFGMKSIAAPVKYDDFQSGTVGQEVGSGPGPVPWYRTSNLPAYKPKYSNTQQRVAGDICALQKFDITVDAYNSTLGLAGYSYTKLYVSGWYYNTTKGVPSRNVKIISFRGGNAGDWKYPNGRLDVYPVNGSGHMYPNDCSGVTGPDKGTGADLKSGQWNRFEVWIDQGSPGQTDGEYWIWRNFKLWNKIEKNTYSIPFINTNCPYNNVYLMSYYAGIADSTKPVEGGSCSLVDGGVLRNSGDGLYYTCNNGKYSAGSSSVVKPSMDWFWSEVYIDTTQARVEIGNASTWDACTHREIQIPKTWSDSAITATVNQGTFKNGEAAYVFVVDANGNVSPGKQITFSGEYIPDPPTCTSFTYSSWSDCQLDNTRTRTVISSSPANCIGGNPVTSELCVYNGGDTVKPKVDVFNVSPLSGDSQFTISYEVSDETALKQVELWRTIDENGPKDSAWILVPGTTKTISGTNYTGAFIDTPPSAGTYWYGMHVVDQSGNVGGEPGSVKVEFTQTNIISNYYDANNSNEIQADFGAAYDVFSQTQELVLKGEKESNQVVVRAGKDSANSYLWRTGYVWRNNSWQPFTYASDSALNSPYDQWIAGKGKAITNITDTELNNGVYVLAYICDWINNNWKCGCKDNVCSTSHWQLQRIGY
jgi:hypothetical protein